MESIGLGRVGTTSHQHISSSTIINSRSIRRISGEGGLPVSLSTIVIDRVPTVCLRAFRLKRPSSSRKGLRPSSTKTGVGGAAAASLTAVVTSPTDSNSVQVSEVDNNLEVGFEEQGNENSETQTKSRKRDGPRRKRKSNEGLGIALANSDSSAATTPNSDPKLQRLAEALESAYHKDATTNELDYESILRDLEEQTRIVGKMASGTAEGASCSSPTMSSVRKRRGKPPKENSVTQKMDLQQAPSVISPLKTQDGFVVRSVPSVVVKRRAGEGKSRLNLMSRIALRKRKQDRFQLAKNASPIIGRAAQDIWSQEAENLINKYEKALELGVVDWEKLKRGLLSAEEEAELAVLMKPTKELEKVRKALTGQVGRDPTDEEWAAAAQMDVHTLRRHIHLGKAARNKLIQHNLRLVLFQANKYYRKSLSLSLFDLCQEGVSGLLQGVDKFDPKKGHRFSTYVVYWVRNSILRAQTRSGSSLRSPYNVAMHKLNIKRARLDLLVELERAPTDEEVMERLGLSPERFRDIVNSSILTESIHKPSSVTGKEVVETIEDKTNEEPWGTRYNGDDDSLRFGVDELLDTLKPREGLVLRQRFGLDGYGERTLGEIGQTLGVSREMIRKYEASALMKMKHPSRMDYLRSYLS